MWFCELQSMPRLRDCARELAARAARWAGDRLTSLARRPAAPGRSRVEAIARTKAPSRFQVPGRLAMPVVRLATRLEQRP